MAKGFLRQLGYDYNETLSLVSEPITIRILLTLAITQKWSLKQLDVNNALINRILEEDIYMTQPPGLKIPTSTSCVNCIRQFMVLNKLREIGLRS